MRQGPLSRSFGIPALVLALCIVLWPAFGRGAPLPRVVLLDRPDSDEVGLELSARLRGELRAAGFDVVVLALAEGTARAPQAALRELEPAAVLVVGKSEDPESGLPIAEIRLAISGTPNEHVQRATLPRADPSPAIAKFAVQAAELVKARLAELTITVPRSPAEDTPLDAGASFEPSTSRATDGPALRATFGAALGALTDLAAGDTVLLPLLRAGVLFHRANATDFELRVTAGATGNGVGVGEGDLRAELRPAFGSLEAVVRFDTGGPLEPSLTVGGGAHTLVARGLAPEGYVTRSRRAWSALGTAGLGLSYTPVSWLRWTAEGQALAVVPPTIVRLAGRDLPERGAWLVLVSSGIAGVF